jgi:hypothetical protein
MTRKITRELTIVSYRVVEEISDDDENPSLPPGPAAHVYDTTCDEVSQFRPLAKCSADRAMKKAGAR